ncbi:MULTISPECIES: TerD family protein [unclassified Streptomyces]|uniref:TerD family protein n=1 Tax=unclassified Streptomyces TaxID=2593676 RepID=UPI0038100F99
MVAGGEEVVRYAFDGAEFTTERAVMLGDFYLKDVWRFAAVGQGFDGGLDALLKNFGGEVAEEAPAAPEPQAGGPVPGFAPPAFSPPSAPAPAFGVPAGPPAPAPQPVRAAQTIVAPMAPPAAVPQQAPAPPPPAPSPYGQVAPSPYGQTAPVRTGSSRPARPRGSRSVCRRAAPGSRLRSSRTGKCPPDSAGPRRTASWSGSTSASGATPSWPARAAW